MAGTNIFGAVEAKTTFVSKSSARPEANLARRSAVVGAMTIKSFSLAINIWGTFSTSLQRSVTTFRPDNASQVALPTKFKLAEVGTTSTMKPSSCSRRSSSQDLYAEIPPETPSKSFRPRGNMVTD